LDPDDQLIIAAIGIFLDRMINQSLPEYDNSDNEYTASTTFIALHDPFKAFASRGIVCEELDSFKIYLFVKDMIAELGCTAECHVLALILTARLARVTGFEVTEGNWPAVFTCAFCIAQKMQDDASLASWDFVDVLHDVCGQPHDELLDIKEFNLMEGFFLAKLGYRTQVSHEEYSAFMNELAAIEDAEVTVITARPSTLEEEGLLSTPSVVLGASAAKEQGISSTQYFDITDMHSPLPKTKHTKGTPPLLKTRLPAANLLRGKSPAFPFAACCF
jgi:hypothetical protein